MQTLYVNLRASDSHMGLLKLHSSFCSSYIYFVPAGRTEMLHKTQFLFLSMCARSIRTLPYWWVRMWKEEARGADLSFYVIVPASVSG